MIERDDQSIDHELSGIAMAAAHEHEQTVAANETEAALQAVRSRVAGGDLGGAPPSIDLVRERRRRSPLIQFGAAAAVIAMIGLGLVAVVGGDRTNDVITPITVPAGPAPSTVPATTGVESVPSTTVGEAADPTVAETPDPNPNAFDEQTVTVDAADPPQLIEPTVRWSVPIDPTSGEPFADVAIADDSVIVKQRGIPSVVVLDRASNAAREVVLAEDLSWITAGPFGTLYGIGDPVFDEGDDAVPRALRFVGISLVDDGPADAGQVFAAGEVDVNRYLELPPYPFGTGATGIVDRTRDVGETLIEFSEGRDAEVGALNVPVPRFAENDEGVADPATGRVIVADRGWAWNLDIMRDVDNNSGFFGPSSPAPTTGDRVIYFDRIGAAESDADFARNELPVIAILDPDGSGRFVGLPEDWDVVASDVTGTVLMRTTATDFELALLDDTLEGEPADAEPDRTRPIDPAPTLGTGSTLAQPSAIERNCVEGVDGITCTQLAATESGRIVAFDPTRSTIRVYDADGTELQSQVEIVDPLAQPFLVAVGPDDVAYVRTFPPTAVDNQADLVAIPLVGTDAGSVVMQWTGVSANGDQTLVSRKTGLTSVGCCGPRVTRPEPDAAIYRWVDRTGAVIESTEPSFDLNLGEAGNSLTRIDTGADAEASFTRFALPTAFQNPRDFPIVVPTDDGGALAYDASFVGPGTHDVFVDFESDWPDSGIDNGDVYYSTDDSQRLPVLLEQAGTVLVVDGDGYARRDLDDVTTRGWPGSAQIVRSPEGAVIEAAGLNDYIDAEQPYWAGVPELFALQIKQFVGPNEQVSVEFDDASTMLAVTTLGFLDDSTAGEVMSIDVEIGDDGLLRFVSGSVSQICQPGREPAPDSDTGFCI